MPQDPPQDYDELAVRVLITELLRFKEAGDFEGMNRIHRELRDVMSRPVLPRSTVRRIP